MLFTNQCSLLLLIKKKELALHAYHMEGLFLFLEFDLLFNDLTI